MEPIKHIKITKGEKASKIIKDMASCGFGARHLSQATNILEQSIKDKECKLFLGFAGALVPGGMKEIIIDMLEQNYIDIFVTTGANLTHDLIEALGFKHYKRTEKLDDKELNKKGIDRIYNVLMKNQVYGKIEDFFTKNFNYLSKAKSPKEFLWKLGSLVKKRSILQTCYKKKIPIFCPALTDSGIGLMIWGQLIRKKKINLDFFRDVHDIIELSWQSKKTAVFYIGGGVPKNFIQQTMQFTRPAIYGVQITTDRPEPGGSSGAPLKEGISWGKMAARAKFVDVFCDATIALPLIHAALKDRIK
ncbi:MAG: deoxyhypusine synthase [Candidatus Pacearchaeota archaeon]|nr:MAG: deoxyhypusine synthase [Candidatus Pacearchaeota archaeon]